MASETPAIWQEMHGRLRAFIVPRVRNAADADDIVQEVFLRIHQRIETLERADRLNAWVYQITRNAIIDHYRSPVIRREMTAGDSADLDAITSADLSRDDADPDGTNPQAELAACLTPMLDRLPAKYRQAIMLTDFDGMNQREAAQRLGLSLPNMKARVQRARQQLKAMLLDCCHIELDARHGVMDYQQSGTQGCDRCAS